MALQKADVLNPPKDKQAIKDNADKNTQQDTALQNNDTLDAEQGVDIKKNKDDLAALTTKVDEHIEKDILEDNDIVDSKSIKFNKNGKVPVEFKVETDGTGDVSSSKELIDGVLVETKTKELITREVPGAFTDNGNAITYGDAVDSVYLAQGTDYVMVKIPIPSDRVMFRLTIRGGKYTSKIEEWGATISGFFVNGGIVNYAVNKEGSMPPSLKFYAMDVDTLEKRIYIGPMNSGRYSNIVLEEVQLFHNTNLVDSSLTPPSIDIATAQEAKDLKDKLDGNGNDDYNIKTPKISKETNFSYWQNIKVEADSHNDLELSKESNKLTMTKDLTIKNKSFYNSSSLLNIYGDYVSAHYSIGLVRYLVIDMPLLPKNGYDMVGIKLESFNYSTIRSWEDDIHFYFSKTSFRDKSSFVLSTGSYQQNTTFMILYNTANKDSIQLVIDRGTNDSEGKYVMTKIKSLDFVHVANNKEVAPTIRPATQVEQDVYTDFKNGTAVDDWTSTTLKRYGTPYTKLDATINGETQFGIKKYMILKSTSNYNAFLHFTDQQNAQTFYIGHGNVDGDEPSARLKSSNQKFVFDFDNNVRFIKGIKVSPDDDFHKAAVFDISPFDNYGTYEFDIVITGVVLNIECTYLKDGIFRNANMAYPPNSAIDISYDNNSHKLKVEGLGASSTELKDSYVSVRITYTVDREGN